MREELMTTENSRSLRHSNVFVHSFLHDKRRINSTPTEIKGVRTYKVHGGMHVMVNDIILKWSDNDKYKVAYRIRSSRNLGGGNVGTMEDIVALDRVNQEVINAIMLMDPVAAYNISSGLKIIKVKKETSKLDKKWPPTMDSGKGSSGSEEDWDEMVCEGDIEDLDSGSNSDLDTGESREDFDEDLGEGGGGGGWECM
jgi:hypothetical protein